ncbi:AraC family transcriptional regulator [Flavobacterium sp. HBTb2-11-1]|uniref:helix-turn-helix domain-containing protein n=1 Tax=Flavobacterium sp. HBTb2-11-1 TaxID=2692212 RepID=UPI0013679CED|nr:AraC family transcriptional regulator [Flavobacterium sp. HBTb2-11-1]MXO06631.1 helix-turn-helix domain-containing protein [Flavobacterium sp. HBTb2-11-1]
MKIKATLLTSETPIIKIQIGDNYYPKSILKEENINIQNGNSEKIISRHLITEGLVLLDTQMYYSTPRTVMFEIDEESVVMNFIYSSNVETHIDQLESEKYSKKNTHNIFYTNNFKGFFTIPALTNINYMSIILSKEFYYNIINEDWQLHEKFSKKILNKQSTYLTSKYLPFTPAIQWVTSEIKNCSREGLLKRIYIESKIKELLIHQIEALTLKPLQTENINQEEYGKLLVAKEILENDYRNTPTLPELSRLISLNEFKLKKGFKACFGTTVKSYIIKLRMEHAKELFQSKTATVSEAAYKCGYKDVSHFSAAFKSYYGFSPQKFKINTDSIQFWLIGFSLLW